VVWPGDLRPSGWVVVPFLLAFLAAAGFLFRRAARGSSWSARSRAAARTGLLGLDVGVDVGWLAGLSGRFLDAVEAEDDLERNRRTGLLRLVHLT
jgi:hypothetical protein